MSRSIIVLFVFLFANSMNVEAQALLDYLQCEDLLLKGEVSEVRQQDPFGNWMVYEYDQKGRVISLSRLNQSQKRFFQYDADGQLISLVEKNGGRFEDSTAFRYGDSGELLQTYYFLENPQNLYETWHYHYDSKDRPYFTVLSRMDEGILQIETAIYQDFKNKVALYTNEDWRYRTWWYYESRQGCINPVIRYIKDKSGETVAAYTKRIEPGKTKPTEVLIVFQNDIYGNWIKKTSKFIRGKRQEVFQEERRIIKYWDEN